MPDNPFGVTLRFVVKIGGLSLGDWTKCEGLTVEYEVEEYKEGGQNAYVHRLPGRAKYQNIKLTRPLDRRSREVLTCLARVQQRAGRQTGSIELRDAANARVIRWKLDGVFPVKWTGPSLDLGANNAAIEALELAHLGFQVED
jgi:phage tail-like protein